MSPLQFNYPPYVSEGVYALTEQRLTDIYGRELPEVKLESRQNRLSAV